MHVLESVYVLAACNSCNFYWIGAAFKFQNELLKKFTNRCAIFIRRPLWNIYMAFWGVFYTIYSGIRRIAGQPPEEDTSDKEQKRYTFFWRLMIKKIQA